MLTIAVLAATLAAPVAGFTLVQSTARADYYVLTERLGLRVEPKSCEAFLEEAEKKTGVRVPRFSYFRVGTEAEVSRVTGSPFAVGIAEPNPSRMWSVWECHRHEIAHLVAFQFTVPGADRALNFWHEGFAAWFAGEYGRLDRWNLRQELTRKHKRAHGVHWAIAAFQKRVPHVRERNIPYRMASSFTHYLIEEHGLDRYLDFFREMEKARIEGFESGIRIGEIAFQRVYGMSIREASDQWLD